MPAWMTAKPAQVEDFEPGIVVEINSYIDQFAKSRAAPIGDSPSRVDRSPRQSTRSKSREKTRIVQPLRNIRAKPDREEIHPPCRMAGGGGGRGRGAVLPAWMTAEGPGTKVETNYMGLSSEVDSTSRAAPDGDGRIEPSRDNRSPRQSTRSKSRDWDRDRDKDRTKRRSQSHR